MLLESPDDSLDFAHAQQRQTLWALYGTIEHLEIPAGTAEIILAANTSNVSFVLWNRSILHKVNEDVADAIDTLWRQAPASLPRNYLYRGEEHLQRLRLHPRPAEAGRLQVIKQIQPPPGVAHWYNAILSLLTMYQLSISDIQRSRTEVAKVILPIMEYIQNGTATTRRLHRR